MITTSSEKAQVKPHFEMREGEYRGWVSSFATSPISPTLYPHTYPPISPKSLSCISLFTPVPCILEHSRHFFNHLMMSSPINSPFHFLFLFYTKVVSYHIIPMHFGLLLVSPNNVPPYPLPITLSHFSLALSSTNFHSPLT